MADPPIRAVHPLAPACSPLPLPFDEYPLLRAYLHVPDADYLPPSTPSAAIPDALTTCPRPLPPLYASLSHEAASSFPVGAEVDCWFSEDDEETFWGVVLDTSISNSSSSLPFDEEPKDDEEVDEGWDGYEDDGNFLLVRFDEDAEELWIPASWCDPLEALDVWEPDNTNEQFSLLYTSDENPVNLFHRAFRIIARNTNAYKGSPVYEGAGVLFVYDTGVAPEVFWKSYQRNIHQTEDIHTYQPVTPDVAATVDHKYRLYLNYRGTDAAEAFPVTYGTVREALDDADNGDEREDDGSLYFVKDAGATLGQDIRVLRLSELRKEGEVEEGDYVIQKSINHILTVENNNGVDEGLRGRRFDIRFYLLIFRGILYVHSHMFGKWTWTEKPYDPTDSSIANNVPNVGPNAEKESERVGRDLHYFSVSEPMWEAPPIFCPKDTGFNPRQWRMAILDSLRLARPVFESILEATAIDPTRYVLLGGDAVMQKSGKAVLIEFNHFAGFGLHSRYEEFKSDTKRDCMRRLILENPRSPCEYTIASQEEVMEPKVGIGYLSDMFKDVAAMVLGLKEAKDIPHFREV